MTKGKTRTILFQILGSIVTIMLIAIILIVTFSYQSANKTMTEDALEAMKSRLTLEELRLKTLFDNFKHDIVFIAEVPPIQGIIRSDKHEGYDPDENTTRELWRQRLASIFTVLLKPQPHYIQARFIGHADGGREIVRVDRVGDEIKAVEEDMLQAKGDRPYFIETKKHKKDDIHLSRIDLNQEWGKIVEPYKLVTRVSMPVYDETSDEFYGIVIINVEMTSILRQLKTLLPDTYFLLTDESGHYLYNPAEHKSYGFDLERNKDERLQNDFPETKALFERKWQELTPHFSVGNGSAIIASVKINLFDKLKERFVVLSLVTSREKIIERSIAFRNKIFFISAITLLVLLIVAYLNTLRIIKPIKALTNFSKKVARGEFDEVGLSGFNNDEIGMLATSFNYMVNKIKERDGELKEANNALNEYIAEIERVNEELNRFSHTVSHDLKNPLTSISGMSSLLYSKYSDEVGEDGKYFIDSIVNSVRIMDELINGLLELSKIGRVEAEKEDVNTCELIQNILKENQNSITLNKVKVELDEGLPNVYFSGIRAYQVFSNLIKNALKFMRSDVTPEISIGFYEKENEHIFYVADNGIGVREEDSDKVFDMFSRLKIKDVEGTGIGLAITKKIIEENGGRIWLKSNENEGTTFYVTFLKSTPDD